MSDINSLGPTEDSVSNFHLKYTRPTAPPQLPTPGQQSMTSFKVIYWFA